MMHKQQLVVAFVAFACALQFAEASIQATYSGTFRSVVGIDSLGLGGASFDLILEYESGSVYIERFGLPAVDSISHSLEVSGSTAGADGSYFENDGIAIYPTFNGQLFAGGPSSGFAEFVILGQRLSLGYLVTPVGGISVGDTIDVTDFGTSLSTTGVVVVTNDTLYRVIDFASSVTANSSSVIPEPTMLIVWAGLACCGTLSSKRRR